VHLWPRCWYGKLRRSTEESGFELFAWKKAALHQARFEVSVAVHHMFLLVAVFYVAVVSVSLWWGYVELVEHGRSWAWWEWPVWGTALAAFWFMDGK
jgi:hypothetical protein